MGERELQDALRARAAAEIDALWRTAEAAVAARRGEVAAAQAELIATAEREAAAASAATRRELLAAVEHELRRERLAAEQELDRRLYALATRLIATLGARRRERLWQALSAELPAGEWRRLRVHPDDLARARAAFPDAEVVVDEVLAGGLVAATADGRIVIDNSLSGRLERAWPELLVPLVAAVNAEVERHAAGDAAAG